MLHGFLSVALPAVLTAVYLDTCAREPIARAAGRAWVPSAMIRRRMNGIVGGCSLALTALLFMAAAQKGSVSAIAEVTAALSLFNAAVHVSSYHLLLRRAQIGQGAPMPILDQFLDPWRLNYLDIAVYWAAVFVIVQHV
jgi:hypothetical protein